MRETRVFGSVIHGTHRPQDLIPAFLSMLRRVNPEGYIQLATGPFGAVPAYVQDEGDSSEWWDSEDAALLLEGLFERLNESCGPHHYFGAHPGDGSDFGFWEYE